MIPAKTRPRRRPVSRAPCSLERRTPARRKAVPLCPGAARFGHGSGAARRGPQAIRRYFTCKHRLCIAWSKLRTHAASTGNGIGPRAAESGSRSRSRRNLPSMCRAKSLTACANRAKSSRSARAAASTSCSPPGNWRIEAIVPSCRIRVPTNPPLAGFHQPVEAEAYHTSARSSITSNPPRRSNPAGYPGSSESSIDAHHAAWGRPPASHRWHPHPFRERFSHSRRIHCRRANASVHYQPAIFAGCPSKRVNHEVRYGPADRHRRAR